MGSTSFLSMKPMFSDFSRARRSTRLAPGSWAPCGEDDGRERDRRPGPLPGYVHFYPPSLFHGGMPRPALDRCNSIFTPGARQRPAIAAGRRGASGAEGLAIAEEFRNDCRVASTLDIDRIQALFKFIDTDPSLGLDRKRGERERLPRDFAERLEAAFELIRSSPESPAPAAGASPRHLRERGAVEAAIASYYGPEMAERLRRLHDDLFDDGIDMLIYNFKRVETSGRA